MLEREATPVKGKTFALKGPRTEPNGYFRKKYGDGPLEVVIEGTDEEVFGGSWGFQEGNPACLLYALSTAGINTLSGTTYYGHVGLFGECVHESEIGEEVVRDDEADGR